MLPNQGRGRGRGGGVPNENVWTNRAEAQKKNSSEPRKGPKVKTVKDETQPARKFEEACAAIQANVKKHVSKIVNDSSEDSFSEDDGENDLEIISTVFNLYGKSSAEQKKTEQILKDSLRSGTSVCLICIASLKKADPIWSCSKCYCSLHLPCIQRWAKDSIYFQTEAASDQVAPGQVVDSKKFKWCCPKCRADYTQQLIPTRYHCYCEKVTDPSFDPWLVPHSCGSRCEKPLQPECSHICLLLCHPGPCPPCPQTVTVTCYCSKSTPQSRRCSHKTWSCGAPCSALLSCNEHSCEEICHEGPCPPCPRMSNQKCLCGATSEQRPCHLIKFQCNKVCGKSLDCGNHSCEVTCHSGKCPPCPLSLQRTCPCGKKAVTVPCITDVGTCGDTCNKLLECGVHRCAERCHKGKCGTCWQMRTRRCRCGVKEKELPCYKDFFCESKCKRIKDCRRHPCNRKCCFGTCPSCDQQCNRTLGCKNHKCASRCHQGPCYPCPVNVEIACACGKTLLTVPCGSERHTKPPKCNKNCKKPPKCHHESQTKHSCHFGDCPACQQPCKKEYPLCGHICRSPCHTAVMVEIAAPQLRRAGPWEPIQAARMELQSLPCPPCQVPMPVTCLGGHETRDWPCHKATPSSCCRPCGQLLACTNHSCTKPCHLVKGTKACQLCEDGCAKGRPEGCTHPCPRGLCHPGPCPPCMKFIKHSCHCGLYPQFLRCDQLANSSASSQPDIKEQLLSCKDRCPKLIACGHRCWLNCHSGSCGSPADCTSTVKTSCPCKRIKRTVACNAQKTIDCDEVCRKKKAKEMEELSEKERTKREEEARLNELEVEQFQRKFDKQRKHDRRRRRDEPTPQPQRPIYVRVLAVLVPTVVLLSALWWTNS